MNSPEGFLKVAAKSQENELVIPVVPENALNSGRWQDQQLCAYVEDPNMFFPEGDDSLERLAKRICGRCAVWQACLYEALLDKEQEEGIRGGKDKLERRAIKQKLIAKGALAAVESNMQVPLDIPRRKAPERFTQLLDVVFRGNPDYEWIAGTIEAEGAMRLFVDTIVGKFYGYDSRKDFSENDSRHVRRYFSVLNANTNAENLHWSRHLPNIQSQLSHFVNSMSAVHEAGPEGWNSIAQAVEEFRQTVSDQMSQDNIAS